ncbi:PhzF family phenazine biosynthesis protein [Sphingomonas paeninsulae]|uniref:PhzF family phenazine biosynthesis protein n=1 Tax=Sphingomonas paeninsulae TaxID=2319844 RepID=A0A494TG05_SPHPE|nr:PhzF family phenazine biosynthesis protein [Sphingomonas paeninsulae]AYJ86324.1 PhzF family phenazine biosynthesis protein [Sphingomonas paeninsulae]
MKLPFVQIDAFADRPFTGNPAAVMPLEAWLPDEVLQAIAAENNLAETAFILPTMGDADFELRWFTPVAEVVMCGHATLASGHYVLSKDAALGGVRFRTRKAGVLSVARDGVGYALSLPAWKPSPKAMPEFLAALGVESAVETLWHENRYGVVVLENAAAVRAVAPDFPALAVPGDWLTIVTAPGDDTDIISRAFAPGAGIDEDPVTGSAHAVVVPYWAERLGRDRMTAFQASARGGYLDCTLTGDRVVLGGKCVTVIEGVFSV